MATIHYARLDEFWRKTEKYAFLEEQGHVGNIDWQLIAPDKRHNWLTEGMQDEFERFLPIGTKETKSGVASTAIFELFSNGVKTNRDVWAYNFSSKKVATYLRQLIEVYNEHVNRLSNILPKPNLDDFVSNDTTHISWSEGLKNYLGRQIILHFSESGIRTALYRPFNRTYLYFDPILTERRYQFPSILPKSDIESENRIICITDKGSEKPFMVLITSLIPIPSPSQGMVLKAGSE